VKELLRWQVGDVRITRVQELEAPDLRFVIREATVENLAEIDWLGPFRAPNGHAVASVHTLILEVGERRIAVDTCIGNDKPRPIPGWNMMKGAFLEDLEKAGFAPTSIDTVICTHLHIDHVGWLAQDGKPFFPNAVVRFGAADWGHYQDNPEGNDPLTGPVMQAVADADRIQPIDADGETIAPGITARFAPGHTPGHHCLVLSSGRDRALLLGDSVTCPVQLEEPDWQAMSDVDAALASRTRESLWRELEGTDTVAVAAHFPDLRFGRVLAGQGKRYWN